MWLSGIYHSGPKVSMSASALFPSPSVSRELFSTSYCITTRAATSTSPTSPTRAQRRHTSTKRRRTRLSIDRTCGTATLMPTCRRRFGSGWREKGAFTRQTSHMWMVRSSYQLWLWHQSNTFSGFTTQPGRRVLCQSFVIYCERSRGDGCRARKGFIIRKSKSSFLFWSSS